jgi:hypothetical protein
MIINETMNAHIDTAGGSVQISEPLIRDDPRLDAMVMDESRGIETIQRLLGVALVGSLIYGLAVGLTAQFVAPRPPLAVWLGRLPVVTLPLAFTGAFLVALLVCLPSFYFYTQLSGLDASFRLITAQALRVQARTVVLLLGALPIYVALALGVRIGAIDDANTVILVGVAMPFVIGLAGLKSLYRSFERLAEQLPISHVRRPQFLLRIVVAWAAAYSVVCPVALYRVGELLANVVAR